MKTIITKNERLQLIALLTMANQHYLKSEEYCHAIENLLGMSEEERYDFPIFETYSEEKLPDVDEVLKDQNIKVK